jgi:WD40 repeat protein
MSLEVVKIREFIGHSQAIYALCYEHSTQRIFSGAGDGMIVCWAMDHTDGRLVIQHHQAVYTLANDTKYLYSGTRSGLLSLFFLEDYALKKHLQLCEAPIFEILPIQDGFVVAAGDGCLYYLDADAQLIKKIQLSNKPIRTIIGVNNTFYAGASDGNIYRLDSMLNVIDLIAAQNNSVFSLAYSKDSEQLICGGRDAVLKWFDVGKCVREVKAHLLHIHRLALHEDGCWMASSSMDKTIKLWETSTGKLLKVISAEKYGAHTSSVNKILWIDKNTIISCSDDRTLKCFEIQEK